MEPEVHRGQRDERNSALQLPLDVQWHALCDAASVHGGSGVPLLAFRHCVRREDLFLEKHCRHLRLRSFGIGGRPPVPQDDGKYDGCTRRYERTMKENGEEGMRTCCRPTFHCGNLSLGGE